MIAQTATTVSHDALGRDTGAIVAKVPDPADPPAPGDADGAEAADAVARLEAISDDLRGCVILAADRVPLAASGDLERWARAAEELAEAADAAAGEPVTHAHIATEDGEAFLVRLGGFTLVAAAERFALAALMLTDMRAVLRELQASAA